MSRIATKWVVLREYPVTGADLDGDGAVCDETLLRWVAEVRDAYLERCTLLRSRPGLVVRHRTGAVAPGALAGRPQGVVVSASASEFRPASFAISVRVRPYGGDHEFPLNVTCTVRLEDEHTGEVCELGTEVRDELIALEHAAEHYN